MTPAPFQVRVVTHTGTLTSIAGAAVKVATGVTTTMRLGVAAPGPGPDLFFASNSLYGCHWQCQRVGGASAAVAQPFTASGSASACFESTAYSA